MRVNAGGIVLNKIPAIIRPSMKRAATTKITGATAAGATTTTSSTGAVGCE